MNCDSKITWICNLKEHFSIVTLYFLFFNRTITGMCERRLWTAKFDHPPSHEMHSRAFFYMVRHVYTYYDWIVVGDQLFAYFLSFLLLTIKVHSCHLFVCCLLESDIASKPKLLGSAWLPDLTLLPFNDLNLSIQFRGIGIFSSDSVVIRRLFGSVCVFFNF